MGRYLIVVLSFLILSCSASKPLVQDSGSINNTGWVLWFDEKRPGEPGGKVRMLVTQDYLRIDAGKADDDFLLYNRKTGDLDSVVLEDETIFSLSKNIDMTKLEPKELAWKIETEESHAVTDRLGVKKSEFRKYFINGQECRSVVSVPDFLPEVLRALKEYQRALSKELIKGLQYQPADDFCYLGFSIYDPEKYLEAGFPVREWDKKGYQRFLKEYQSGIVMPQELFTLPKNFSRYGSQ